MSSGSAPNLGVHGSAISELCQGKQPCFSSTLSWQEVCTLSEESDLRLNAATLEHFKLLLYKENGGSPLCKPEKFWYFPGPLFPSHTPTRYLFADSLSETKENAVTWYKLQHKAEITQQQQAMMTSVFATFPAILSRWHQGRCQRRRRQRTWGPAANCSQALLGDRKQSNSYMRHVLFFCYMSL